MTRSSTLEYIEAVPGRYLEAKKEKSKVLQGGWLPLHSKDYNEQRRAIG